MDLPAKLHPDLIREALFEVRFEHAELPELFVGSLASSFTAEGWTAKRLENAEIPESLRNSHPQLRYLPTIELVRADAASIVRLGPYAASYHIIDSYPGWDAFKPALLSLCQSVRSVPAAPRLTRFGLRYLNAPTVDRHDIASVWDLDLDVRVAGARPADDISLTYRTDVGPDLQCIVRVISPAFVEGQGPDATAVVDIDMNTPDSSGPETFENVEDWLVRAHDTEKRTFFALLTERTTAKLRER